jgi:hypothetical protein
VAVSQSSKVNTKRNLLKAARAYVAQGFHVIKLHGNAGNGCCTCGYAQCRYVAKHPATPHGIEDATQDPATIKRWFGNDPLCNIGIVFGSQYGFIDIETDTKHQGDEHLPALESRYGALPDTFSFISGTGGTHRVYRVSSAVSVRRRIGFGATIVGTKQTGIDVLGDKSYAVAPPSIHANGETYTVHSTAKIANVPPTWVAPLTRGILALPASDVQALSNASAVLDDVTTDQAQAMLDTLNPDLDYHEWIKVGQALKTQFGDAGGTLFLEWSAKGSKFPGRDALAQTWRTLGKGATSNPVTMRSVIAMAQDAGYKQPTKSTPLTDRDKERTADIIDIIDLATTKEELKHAADETRKQELFKESIEKITIAFIAATRSVLGTKLSKHATRVYLSNASGHVISALKAQEWYKSYLYVESENGSYYNVQRCQDLSVKVFNDKHARDIVTDVQRAQGVTRPVVMPGNVVLDAQLIPMVRKVLYVPGKPATFDYNGSLHGNAYQPYTPTIGDAAESDAGRDAVAFVRSHLEWMLGREAAKLMEQFLSYTVQRPGERIRWCYLILGPKGAGKSFISSLMRAVLGGNNVRDVHQATLQHTQFNAWAVGSQLTVIEEIRVDGAKKWEIMNSLKAIITNDTIDVHAKGKDPYNAPSTSNFLAYSNDPNAISPDADDRRYYITSTTLSTAQEVIDDLAGASNRDAYFDKLYSLPVTQPAALLAWLQSVDLTGFSPSAAPPSQDKAEMAAVSRPDEEVSVEETLESGIEGVCPALIGMNQLRAHMSINHPGMSGQRLGRILRSLGYKMLPCGPIDAGKTGNCTRWMYSPAHVRAWVAANGVPVDVKRPLHMIRAILSKRK